MEFRVQHLSYAVTVTSTRGIDAKENCTYFVSAFS